MSTSTFSPQLVMPSAGDPYYNTAKNGGFNPCIPGNPKNRQKDLNVLPNCVGYAVGRFNAIGGYGSCKYLGNTNAANFANLARRQGLRISSEPLIGGCMVWKGGQTGEGHVAIVEMDLGNRIVTSESEYYGKPFTIYQRFGQDWRNGCYWMGSSYSYLGCIVNPAVKKEEDMTREETREMIYEIVPKLFPEMMAEYKKALAKLPPDDWALQYIERVKAAGLMGGDPDGNFRPKSDMTRQELAAVLSNMLPDR